MTEKFIVYNKEHNEITDYKDLKRWSTENIDSRYIDELDAEYYNTGLVGWEVIFDYLFANAYKYGIEADVVTDNYEDRTIQLYSDLELFKLIKEENGKYNLGLESSNMDLYYSQGFWEDDEVDF